jgi:Domain of unknown function (DUF4281)/Terpene cyclase DEP1
MNLEFLYSAFTMAVSVGWWLLILAPEWRWTDRVVHRVWMPFALGVWCLTLEVLKPALPEGAGMGSLQAVVLLTNGPYGTLMSWTLLMSWDLFAGAWLARDARRRGIHHAWVVACLLVTLVFGFVGLLLYLTLRSFLLRTVTLHESRVDSH